MLLISLRQFVPTGWFFASVHFSFFFFLDMPNNPITSQIILVFVTSSWPLFYNHSEYFVVNVEMWELKTIVWMVFQTVTKFRKQPPFFNKCWSEEYINKSCCFITYFMCFYTLVSVHCQHATSLELPGIAAFCHLSSFIAKNLYTLVKLTCI